MKPILRISTIFFIILFLGASVMTFAKKKPQASNGNYNPGITYVVLVDPVTPDQTCHQYYVVIRDESGDQVEGALPYQEGITNYVFHESGPVSGIRTACLEMGSSYGQNSCPNNLEAEPFAISGEFSNGEAYFFLLHPQLVAGLN